MAKQSNIEKFLALSDAEKEAEVQRALRAPSRPLTAAQRAHWKKVQASLKAKHAAKTRGRPVTGAGAKVISLSVERTLLARADAAARKLRISRAALVARGLEAVLAYTSR
ncbi:MAG: hypothetical protein JO353_04860 [Phycisphaerae bacterium]|nr:hypothetical protein [Phycisphaerae bacterium]